MLFMFHCVDKAGAADVRAANRAEWFAQVDKPLDVHDILGN